MITPKHTALLSLLCASALFFTTAAHAQQNDPPQKPAKAADATQATQEEGNKISLLLTGENAPEALQVISDATGFSIIPSSQLGAAKLFASIVDMDPEEALKQIVEVNGLHYIRNGKVVWILSDEEYYEDFNLGRERRVIPLSRAKSDYVKDALSEIISKHGVVISYPDTNVIVIAEDKERIQELVDLVTQLDQATETRVFEVKFAVASELAIILQPYVNDPTGIQYDQRTNQLIVKDTPYNLEKVAKLIQSFDRQDTISTRAYPLKYANASDVALVLQNILYGGNGYGASQNGINGARSTNRNSSKSSTGQSRSSSSTSTRSPSASRRPSSNGMYQRGSSAGSLGQNANGSDRAAPASASAPASAAARGYTAPAAAAATAAPAAAQATAAGQTQPQGAQGAAGQNAAGQNAAQTIQGAQGTLAQSGASIDTGVGVLATVVADPRTNSVIITHTEAMLQRLEKIVKSLDVPDELHVYQFQQVNPDDIDISSKLQGLLSEDGGYVDVDPISKKVVFRAGGERAENIMKLLHEWDKASRQVRIEAEILSVNVELARELGITWEAVQNKVQNNILYRTQDFKFTFPPTINSSDKQTQLRIGNLATSDYAALIQALSTDTDTQIIASPKILCRDGQVAEFSSTRDEPYTVVTVAGTSNTTLQDVKFLNVGVQLQVLPIINELSQIVMQIVVENSSLAGRTTTGVPIVDRATAQSTVSVNSGGTVILGGLQQRQRSIETNGVPGLHKIPLIGNLFRSKSHDRTEHEIVLILKPDIMGETQLDVPSVGQLEEKLRGSAVKDKLEPKPAKDKKTKDEPQKDSPKKADPQS
jgi:general secretion pathway protein D